MKFSDLVKQVSSDAARKSPPKQKKKREGKSTRGSALLAKGMALILAGTFFVLLFHFIHSGQLNYVENPNYSPTEEELARVEEARKLSPRKDVYEVSMFEGDMVYRGGNWYAIEHPPLIRVIFIFGLFSLFVFIPLGLVFAVSGAVITRRAKHHPPDKTDE